MPGTGGGGGVKRVERWYRIVATEVRPFAWFVIGPLAVVIRVATGAFDGVRYAVKETAEMIPQVWRNEIRMRARRREILRQRRDD